MELYEAVYKKTAAPCVYAKADGCHAIFGWPQSKNVCSNTKELYIGSVAFHSLQNEAVYLKGKTSPVYHLAVCGRERCAIVAYQKSGRSKGQGLQGRNRLQKPSGKKYKLDITAAERIHKRYFTA